MFFQKDKCNHACHSFIIFFFRSFVEIIPLIFLFSLIDSNVL